MKHPWLKFYTNDWLSDEALRACSFGAKGLWINMLCLMHKSQKRGHLLINNRAPSMSELARMVGGSEDEIIPLLNELKNAGVFTQNGDGIVVSRRMVRDDKKARKCAAAGRKGGGNPKLQPQTTFIGESKGGDKGGSKGTSGLWHIDSSGEGGVGETPERPPLPSPLDTQEFRDVWEEYEAYRRESKLKPLKPRSVKAKWKELQEIGHDGAIEAIKRSIANGWAGIFPGGGGGSGPDASVTRLASPPGKYDNVPSAAE